MFRGTCIFCFVTLKNLSSVLAFAFCSLFIGCNGSSGADVNENDLPLSICI